MVINAHYLANVDVKVAKSLLKNLFYQVIMLQVAQHHDDAIEKYHTIKQISY